MSMHGNPAESAREWIERGAPAYETAEEAQEFLDLIEAGERQVREAAWLEAEVRADEQSAQTRAIRHSAKAAGIGAIRRKLKASAEGHANRASDLVVGRESERMPDDEYATFRKAVDRAVAESAQDAELAKLQRRERRQAEKLRVVAEPGPYEQGSPHSWVRDRLVHLDPQSGLDSGGFRSASGGSDMRPDAVAERLRQHGVDVRSALRRGKRYGKTVERMLRESRRRDDVFEHERLYREDLRNATGLAEIRAVTTGGGTTALAASQAAAFVAPAFLMDRWAEYRSPYRAFADQCNSSVALPAYGMEAYLPIVTTGTTVATQTEASGVSEGDPVTGFSASPIVTKAGQITITQQFLDRAGPGIAGDGVLFVQLKEQLDSQIDAFAIAQALANAQAVTNAGAFALANATAGVGGFLGDLKKAKSKLTDTAGTRLRGTHAFATGDFVDFISSYSDGNARPVFAPELDANHLPIRAQGDGTAEGYSGYVLVGLALFADDNIPNSGSNTQIIVTRADTVLLLEGMPIPYCYPPTYAGNLAPVLGVRCYVATIPHYPSGVSVISGAAYAAAQFA